jgi:hypothetical protein
MFTILTAFRCDQDREVQADSCFHCSVLPAFLLCYTDHLERSTIYQNRLLSIQLSE